MKLQAQKGKEGGGPKKKPRKAKAGPRPRKAKAGKK